MILLGSALVFVLCSAGSGLGATLGYLVAGAVVGPQLLGLVGGAEAMLHVAELGIALLLFLVGLELNPGAAVAAAARTSSGSACCRSCCAASR